MPSSSFPRPRKWRRERERVRGWGVRGGRIVFKVKFMWVVGWWVVCGMERIRDAQYKSYFMTRCLHEQWGRTMWYIFITLAAGKIQFIHENLKYPTYKFTTEKSMKTHGQILKKHIQGVHDKLKYPCNQSDWSTLMVKECRRRGSALNSRELP